MAAMDAMGLSEAQRGKVHVLSGVEEEVSASEVRDALGEGKECWGLVPERVTAYIRGRGLYGVGKE